MNRIVYYSRQDGACFSNLSKVESYLSRQDLLRMNAVNEIMELVHVQLYFDNQVFHKDWDKGKIIELKWKLSQVEHVIKNWFLNVSSENILIIVDEIDYNYFGEFWRLISYFQVYSCIDSMLFFNLIVKEEHLMQFILQHKKLVKFFRREIKDCLFNNPKHIELFITEIEEEQNRSHNYFFNEALNTKDILLIIEKYIESESPNLNYLRLIELSRKSTKIDISTKLKLKARRRSTEISSIIFSNQNTSSGISVGYSETQSEDVIINNDHSKLEIIYSYSMFNFFLKNEFFKIFSKMFEFLDINSQVSLISKKNELNVLEQILVKSKNEYLIGGRFRLKEMISQAQLKLADNFLKENNSSLEKEIIRFINDSLNRNLKGIKFVLNTPNINSSFSEKIRALLPELDFLLKQFKAYVTDGYIDLELIRMDNSTLNFSQIPSLVLNKYYYSNNTEIEFIQSSFFLGKSFIHYTDKFGSKYSNLYDLIDKEEMVIADFDSYQKDAINDLLNKGYLIENKFGVIEFSDVVLLSVVGVLFENESLNYWSLQGGERKVVDRLIESNELISESSLFSKSEIKYFNYYFNSKLYTNGYDLRNSYLHGTNSFVKEENEMHYFLLLKLIVLILIKIENDFQCKEISRI